MVFGFVPKSIRFLSTVFLVGQERGNQTAPRWAGFASQELWRKREWFFESERPAVARPDPLTCILAIYEITEATGLRIEVSSSSVVVNGATTESGKACW